jgi:hypothetical protein
MRIFLIVLVIALVSMANAANYMYEKASVKGVGYKNVEQIISTQTGFGGNKIVEKQSGSGNVITEKTELEAEREFNSGCTPISNGWLGIETTTDYINFTKEAEFEYMPVSYQTGTYDQKWIEKLCVQNYKIGATLTEMYIHAEHLQKSTEVKTKSVTKIKPAAPQGFKWMHTASWSDGYPEIFLTTEKPHSGMINIPGTVVKLPSEAPQGFKWMHTASWSDGYPEIFLTTEKPHSGMINIPGTVVKLPIDSYLDEGTLEANLNSNVIGVAHLGWISRDPLADSQLKGRHAEYGRSVEDLTGVFSIEKFIQLWGNSTCGAISVDWLPCM